MQLINLLLTATYVYVDCFVAMACNWLREDYFAQVMCSDRRSHSALEMLVNDLHSEKERTVLTFLCHAGSEDFLWSLVRLLGNDIPRVAGNAAYIIGTLAESELGSFRIISLAKSHQPESRNVLSDLTQMLTFDDPESVMNAAGTLGTMAESTEGREWMLSESCIEAMLDHVTNLLDNENLWTASNAALVLARLSISEEGCSCILKHPNSQTILTCLIQALGVDEAGRGMNAAFAVGRLCDKDAGRQCMLNFPDSEKMISSLVMMLNCEDAGASKNACFALSCLAASSEGHKRLLSTDHSDDVLNTLSELLSVEDSETGWFAAMTLRTLASHPKGCLRLRELPQVCTALKKVEQLTDVSSDLKEEVLITLEMLRPLEAPDTLTVTVLSQSMCCASWNRVTSRCDFDIWYQLFEDNQCIYDGPKCQYEVSSLLPHSVYSFKVRAVNKVEESPFSQSTTLTTEEDLPEAPTNVRILGTTATQLKVGWSPPENFNGISKGYYVYQGKTMVEHTMELTSIISGLTANTSYEIQVCAATTKGKGHRSSCRGNTAPLGAHAPSKPHVQVLGRNEVHVSWDPPEVPMGRITRYDVNMNGKIIYSGTDLSYGAHRLTPDTEYTFIVTAVTNEGKFDSKVTKRRTSKDESGNANGCHHAHDLVAKPDKGKEDTSLPSSTQKTKLITKDVSTKKENINPRTNKELISSSAASSFNKRRSLSSSELLHNLSSNNSQTMKMYSSRISEPLKSALPVTVSYISIQVGDEPGSHLNAVANDYQSKTTFIQSPAFYGSVNSTFLTELSRKTLGNNNLRSNRNRKFEKMSTNDVIRNNRFHHGSNYSLQSSHSPQEFRLSLCASSEKSVFLLPKPTVPNSCSLDNNRSLNASSEISSTSSYMPNSKTFDDQDTENTEESKAARYELYYHPGRRKQSELNTLDYVPSNLITDSYVHDTQRTFIHRTNTFTRSHRPSLRKTKTKNALVQHNRTASISLPGNKSLTSHAHSKFVPVQLRAQPNNLTASQLQRVNTTLSEASNRAQLNNLTASQFQRVNTRLSEAGNRAQPNNLIASQLQRVNTTPSEAGNPAQPNSLTASQLHKSEHHTV